MQGENQQNRIFTDEQTETFAGFFSTLAKIHKRLIASGYQIKDGKLIPPSEKLDNLRV